jgi:corrinoid protein of di/trimethylamine methyltransferase
MPDLQQLHEAIVNGDASASRDLTHQALAAGVPPLEIVTKFMAPAMDEVGRRFESNEYFVPQLLLSARAMKCGMELIRPLLAARGTEPVGRVAIGTVRGDLHDIGKNLVASMLEGAGFEVFDAGVNVSADKFIGIVRENHCDILALSALLTTTMTSMKETIDAFASAGLRERVKIMVGGAPLSKQFADEIGADGFGASAVEAVAVARTFVAARAV